MSEANNELIRRAWAAYDRGDEDAYAECLTDDWRELDSDGNAETLESERTAMRAHKVVFLTSTPSCIRLPPTTSG